MRRALSRFRERFLEISIDTTQLTRFMGDFEQRQVVSPVLIARYG